ncbi:uncharacterized protein SCODWIG_01019 [Saccharomycodes ludwigii]|uniref:Protein SCM3 n=1 Tax=Saccharomycodes ludwigii TaxID=36035 RepID=A0A376B3I7_9ASCO|nr:uncharacterized protein SCODWIG_01019 [Saccharomycodes ludwigii]
MNNGITKSTKKKKKFSLKKLNCVLKNLLDTEYDNDDVKNTATTNENIQQDRNQDNQGNLASNKDYNPLIKNNKNNTNDSIRKLKPDTSTEKLTTNSIIRKKPKLLNIQQQRPINSLAFGDDDSRTMEEKVTEFVKNGHTYIYSKENTIIPKLTDDEVIQKHKNADENMKKAWLDIISKYENVADQGDVIDLHTGEIIEDNGHLRSLKSNKSRVGDKYVSSILNGITISHEKWNNQGDKRSLSGHTNIDLGTEDEDDEDYIETSVNTEDYVWTSEDDTTYKSSDKDVWEG